MNVEHQEKRADEWERDRKAWNLPPRAPSFIAVQDHYPVDASPEEPEEPRFGLSTHEAVRAVQMSERSGDRDMARPEIKARVEDARGKSAAGLLDDVRDTVEELLLDRRP